MAQRVREEVDKRKAEHKQKLLEAKVKNEEEEEEAAKARQEADDVEREILGARAWCRSSHSIDNFPNKGNLQKEMPANL